MGLLSKIAGFGLFAWVILSGPVLDWAAVSGLEVAEEAAYRDFVKRFWPVARKRVSKEIYDEAFRGLTPDPEVVERNNHQPEFTLPASHYVSLTVNDTRIREGQQKLREYASRLEAIEKRYGVDRHILLSIWGMETSFGQSRGEKNVIRSLSTLAYKGRRARFGRRQLLAALEILQAGDITVEEMTGSWAGAMGHTQFIPTSYLAYAVDFTGDGRRDIWETPVDALASTAHFLRKAGWTAGQTWGCEVILPEGFNIRLAGADHRRSISQWRSLGLRQAAGQTFSRPEDLAYLYLPAGAQGPAFLLLQNFRALMRYNPAPKYALAVGHLADRIRGAPELVQAWPDGVRPLAENDRKELQRLLAAKGYDIGGLDGIIGPKTRAAVRDYQKRKGLRADGFPRHGLLNMLREDNG